MNNDRRSPKKVHFVSLGCAKNLVDTEKLIGSVAGYGAEAVPRPRSSDAIVINTCGFIKPALDETEREIARALRLKSPAVYVCGCAVNRYGEELKRKYPGVRGWFNLESTTGLLHALTGKKRVHAGRRLSTRGYGYLKICDGCSNYCSYCTLPSIKGPFRSGDIDRLVREAHELAALGAREIILVGQDTANYGADIYGRPRIAELLAALAEVKPLRWIRVMYAHPKSVDDRLVEAISENRKVCKYLDLPIQHINDNILERMNRRVSRRQIESLLASLKNIKGMTLRTTVIAGFPGETETEFAELRDFLGARYFDWVGVFPYHRETGTPAASFEQVSPVTIARRYRALVRLQKKIIRDAGRHRRGRVYRILVHRRDRLAFGHAEFAAPEIDGQVISRARDLAAGRFYNMRIVARRGTDLYARPE